MSRYGYRIKLTAIAALGAVFAAATVVPAAQADGRHWNNHQHKQWNGHWQKPHPQAHKKAKRFVKRIERRVERRVERRIDKKIDRKIEREVRRQLRQKHGHNHKTHRRHGHKKTNHVYVPRHTNVYWYKTRPRHSTNFNLNNETGGRLIGAVLGAVVGSQFGKGKGKLVAVAGGAIVGSLIGGEIGSRMDDNDRARSQRVLETAPTGRTVRWVNPDTDVAYEMTPTQTYRNANGIDCREYTTWVFIDGYEEQVRGTACRTADGTWLPTNKG
jgi:surface antigen